MKQVVRTPRRSASSAALFAALLACAGCTQRLYAGAELPRRDVAILDATGSLLWSIDGKRMYVHPLGYIRYELAPGSHSIVVHYETPEEPAAIRQAERRLSPYECSMVLLFEAGASYHLSTRALGLDAARRRWDGRWEAWVTRDGSDDEPIAHCVAQADDSERGVTAAGAPPVESRARGAAAAPIPAPLPAATGATATAAAPPVAAGPTPSPRPLGPQEIRVGTWNLHGMGRGNDQGVARIAAVINTYFDAVALTEVYGSAAGVATSPLAAALGDDWLWLADPRDPSAVRERYVIAYRRSALRTCPGWSAARGYEPSGGERFARPPLYVCLQTPPGEGPPAFDFLLGAYRADWSDGDLSAVAAEVAQLDRVFAAMQSARPGERDLLIAGDFNLNPADVRPLVGAALVVRGTGSTLDLRGQRTANLYDQILVFDPRATAEMQLGMAEVKDVRGDGDPRAFVRTVSDHLPVVLRLSARGPDDD